MRHVVLLALFVMTAGMSASPAEAAVRWFHSPTRNIECEVAAADRLGTYALCQTVRKPKSVTLRESGRMRVCTGNACLGNGPENAFTLRYGRSVSVGPFRCTSLVNGMRCVVAGSGHGFRISRDQLVRF